MHKNVILLNGPSSSGKSTLAKALALVCDNDLGEKYEVVSIDDFLHMKREETIYEEDVYEISGSLCQKAKDLLDGGQSVVIDHVITSKRIFDALVETLMGHEIYVIRVTCPLEELRRREEERGNRCPSSAQASLAYLYPPEGYDLQVDTFWLSAEECAKKIISLLK